MGDRLDTDLVNFLFWMRDVRGLSSSTIRIRRAVLERLSDTIRLPLRYAEATHLLHWQDRVLPGLSAQTRRSYIGHVTAFYRWLEKQGHISHNPALDLDRPRVPRGLPRPIGEEDLRRAIDEAGPKLRAMIVLTAYAGLRVMEVAALRWSDLRQDTHGGWSLLVQGKGRKERMVPVGEYVVRTIRDYSWGRRGPVFLGRDGRQITANGVSHAINDHYQRLGIASTAHAGRHRYITVGVEDLGDVVLMQHLAGHESLQTTQVYAAFSRAKAARLVAALDVRAGLPVEPAG
jgi:integrase/recombinase XerC